MKKSMYAAIIPTENYGQDIVGRGNTLEEALEDLRGNWELTDDEDDFDTYNVEFYKMEPLLVRVEKIVKLVEEEK